MSKEEIALQLTLKALDARCIHYYDGKEPSETNDYIAKEVASFFNYLMKNLTTSEE